MQTQSCSCCITAPLAWHLNDHTHHWARAHLPTGPTQRPGSGSPVRRARTRGLEEIEDVVEGAVAVQPVGPPPEVLRALHIRLGDVGPLQQGRGGRGRCSQRQASEGTQRQRGCGRCACSPHAGTAGSCRQPACGIALPLTASQPASQRRTLLLARASCCAWATRNSSPWVHTREAASNRRICRQRTAGGRAGGRASGQASERAQIASWIERHLLPSQSQNAEDTSQQAQQHPLPATLPPTHPPGCPRGRSGWWPGSAARAPCSQAARSSALKSINTAAAVCRDSSSKRGSSWACNRRQYSLDSLGSLGSRQAVAMRRAGIALPCPAPPQRTHLSCAGRRAYVKASKYLSGLKGQCWPPAECGRVGDNPGRR